MIKDVIKKYHLLSLFDIQSLFEVLGYDIIGNESGEIASAIVMITGQIGYLLLDKKLNADRIDYRVKLIFTDFAILRHYTEVYTDCYEKVYDYIINLLDATIIICVRDESYEAASNIKYFKEQIQKKYSTI